MPLGSFENNMLEQNGAQTTLDVLVQWPTKYW